MTSSSTSSSAAAASASARPAFAPCPVSSSSRRSIRLRSFALVSWWDVPKLDLTRYHFIPQRSR